MKLPVALLAVLVAGCAASAPAQKVARGTVQQDASYALRLAEDEPVLFQGIVDFDGAGLDSRPGMLYGPGAAGFVAGLIAHGAILKGVRENQKSKIQAEADKVLLPFEPILSQFRVKDLVDRTLTSAAGTSRAALARYASGAKAGWLIDSTPVFSMTQDQHAIVLDHVISIARSGSSKPMYQNTIRIVSSSHTDLNPVAYWNANGGERLTGESVRLYRESLDLALRDAAKGAPAGEARHMTVRYREGRSERIERAQIVDLTCDRAVIVTLRGWLMSVPLATPAESCVVQVAQ